MFVRRRNATVMMAVNITYKKFPPMLQATRFSNDSHIYYIDNKYVCIFLFCLYVVPGVFV